MKRNTFIIEELQASALVAVNTRQGRSRLCCRATASTPVLSKGRAQSFACLWHKTSPFGKRTSAKPPAPPQPPVPSQLRREGSPAQQGLADAPGIREVLLPCHSKTQVTSPGDCQGFCHSHGYFYNSALERRRIIFLNFYNTSFPPAYLFPLKHQHRRQDPLLPKPKPRQTPGITHWSHWSLVAPAGLQAQGRHCWRPCSGKKPWAQLWQPGPS